MSDCEHKTYHRVVAYEIRPPLRRLHLPMSRYAARPVPLFVSKNAMLPLVRRGAPRRVRTLALGGGATPGCSTSQMLGIGPDIVACVGEDMHRTVDRRDPLGGVDLFDHPARPRSKVDPIPYSKSRPIAICFVPSGHGSSLLLGSLT